MDLMAEINDEKTSSGLSKVEKTPSKILETVFFFILNENLIMFEKFKVGKTHLQNSKSSTPP